MTEAFRTSLFVTGAAGFVGKQLVQRLVSAGYGHIYCLSRKNNPFLESLAAENENLTIIGADLFDVERYKEALANSNIAIHLAAVTGKASPESYFHVNADGAALFIEQCRLANIRRFLHFSTIAVNFRDVSAYPYARSKQAAEKIVVKSGLKYTIVRPTIIFGRQSPIWQNFLTMARAPIPFIFGNGRTKIQPIHVDDLVEAVVNIIDGDRFDNQAWDIGGSRIITIEELVREIRRKITGQPVRSVVRIPLLPLSSVLRVLEPLALGVLPFTAGQLTSFSCDGVTGANLLMEAIRPLLRPLDEMLNKLIQENETEATQACLANEATRLGKKLSGSEPNEIVVQKYVEAHRQGLITPDRNRERFERIIMGAARIGVLFHLAEAYSAVFHRSGLLRKKLVLITAILECMPGTRATFDIPESENPLVFLCGLSLRSLAFALALLVSIPVFLPLQVLLNMSEKKPVEEVSWKN